MKSLLVSSIFLLLLQFSLAKDVGPSFPNRFAGNKLTLRNHKTGMYLTVAMDDCGASGIRAVEHFVKNTAERGPDTLWETETTGELGGFKIKHVLSNEYLTKGLGSGEIPNQVSTFGGFTDDNSMYEWNMGIADIGAWSFDYPKTRQALVSDETGVYLGSYNNATAFELIWEM